MYTYLTKHGDTIVLPNPHPGDGDRIILEKLRRKITSANDTPDRDEQDWVQRVSDGRTDPDWREESVDGRSQDHFVDGLRPPSPNGGHPSSCAQEAPSVGPERHQTGRSVTHRLGKPRPGTTRLWTILEHDIWTRLCRSEVLYVDLASISSSFFLDFLALHDWMREQMARRLVGYQGHYPWWAWSHRKPNLRRWSSRCCAPGTPYVRLELAVPNERVLLFNEAAWIVVLNRWHLALTRAEDEQWEAELTARNLDPLTASLPEPWNSRRTASWGRIFDLEAIVAGGLYSDAVQATFERLELVDVIRVTEFTAR